MNTELLGLSVDSNSSHLAWMYDIYCRTGIKISFPIIADKNGQIARKYGMIANDISNTETVRNVFIIDDKGNTLICMEVKMEMNQKINCTVSSCKYNNQQNEKCMLQEIQVEPTERINTQEPDESMCASYKHIKD